MEQTTLNSPYVENYKFMVQEAGHALGLSGINHFDAVTGDDQAKYDMAHPDISDAVLNYDKQVGENYGRGGLGTTEYHREPDCSPHSFDILAIYALYQTVVD